MTAKTKELNLLDIEDIEAAVSKLVGREVAIGEMNCTLYHCIPCCTSQPDGAYFELKVDGETIINEYGRETEIINSFDLFYDEEQKFQMLNGKILSLDEDWVREEDIFNFDVSLFKSYEAEIDGSD